MKKKEKKKKKGKTQTQKRVVDPNTHFYSLPFGYSVYPKT